MADDRRAQQIAVTPDRVESTLRNDLYGALSAALADHDVYLDPKVRSAIRDELVDAVEAVPHAGPANWEGCDRAEAIRQAEIYHTELIKTIDERDSLARRCAVRFEEAEKLRAELEWAHADHDQAVAAGWAAAVEALRNDQRYQAWVKRQAFVAELSHTWRAAIASYLEAAAPKATGGDVTGSPQLVGGTGAEDLSDVLRERIAEQDRA